MMRPILLLKATCLLVLFSNNQLFAQANVQLSNLVSPVQINQHLLPGTDNKYNLGSSSKSWKDLYLDGDIYIDGNRFTYLPTSTSIFVGNTANTTSTGVGNAAFGYHVLMSNTSGYQNSGQGAYALEFNTTGSDNAAFGYAALNDNTIGSNNCAFGSFAGFKNISHGSTVVGSFAGYNNGADEITAVGYQALYSNLFGSANSAFGCRALYLNVNGYGNTANGYEALYENSEGYNNTATGTRALAHNEFGDHNTADGYNALLLNEGSYNTGIGSSALLGNVTAWNNTAVGYAAGENNTGSYNSFLGSIAGGGNSEGSYNTGIGGLSLKSNGAGDDNTAVGYAAGENNYASANAFFGYYSGQANTTGTYNSFFGYNSGIANTTGSYNMFFGRNTGYVNTDGSNNVAIGYSANSTAASNDDCTFLGNDADNSSSVDRNNSMALGNTARISASNQVRIGNTLVTSIGGYAGWTNLSDGRFKKNVNEDVPGLEFINQLRPVTYTLDITSLRKANGEDTDAGEERSIEHMQSNQQSINDKEKIVYTGFIAQEVEKTAKELKYDFSGVDAPKNENDFYGLRYAEFVVPLVKAVQELNQENKRLSETLLEEQSKNTELEKRIEKLEQLFSSTTISDEKLNTQVVTLTGAKLEQNIPNPFEQSTTIKYFIPENSGDARINIYSEHGEIIKSIAVTEKGNGQIILNAADLASGAYQYTLVVNGQVVATKQMVRTR